MDIAAGILGFLTLVDTPALSPVPGIPLPATAPVEQIYSVLSTQSQSDCVGRGETCGRFACCDGYYCKESGGGDALTDQARRQLSVQNVGRFSLYARHKLDGAFTLDQFVTEDEYRELLQESIRQEALGVRQKAVPITQLRIEVGLMKPAPTCRNTHHAKRHRNEPPIEPITMGDISGQISHPETATRHSRRIVPTTPPPPP